MTKKILAFVVAVVLVLSCTVMLTACGEKTTYTVTFDVDGGSAVSAQTVEEGGTASKPSDPTKDGYTFAGWVGTDGESFDFSSVIEADTTVKAVWTAVVVGEVEPDNTYVAYGMVHEVYVSKVTVTYKDGDVTDVEIDEVCLPYYVNPRFGSDYLGVTTTYGTEWKVYKSFTFNGDTWTLDESVEYGDHAGDCKGDWKNEDGEYLLASLYADEDLCEAWFNAVINSEIGTLTAKDDYSNKDVLSASTLYKQVNGYWMDGIGLSWAGNVAATCEYIIENDLDAEWFETNSDKVFVDSNGVTTGATWIDMYDYVNLMCKAVGSDPIGTKPAVAEPVTEDGTYDYTLSTKVMGGDCTFVVSVVVAEGKITSVVLADGTHTTGGSYETDFVAGLDSMLASFVGMTPAEVHAATATGDLHASGATMSSSALLEAVVGALTK